MIILVLVNYAFDILGDGERNVDAAFEAEFFGDASVACNVSVLFTYSPFSPIGFYSFAFKKRSPI